MSAAREKWNQRYQNRTAPAPEPAAFLKRSTPQLNKGSVLDIAAGDGAASLWLAQQGFEVTAADISDQGLARLAAFAAEQSVSIQTHCADLEQPGALDGLGRFQNAVITMYKPAAVFWPQLVEHLEPGAKVLLTTYNLQQHQATGFSRRFCLSPDELLNVHPALEVVSYSSENESGDWMDHYLFSYCPSN